MDMPGHGDHDGHGGGDGSRPMCAMNMALNWSTKDVCVLFDFWRINSAISLVATFVAVFCLGYLYELSRSRVRRWELMLAPTGVSSTLDSANSDDTPLVGQSPIPNSIRWKRAIFYGLLVAYSYSLMLIFMTYNGYLILAVIGGAIAGNYAYSTDSWGNVRGANCH